MIKSLLIEARKLLLKKIKICTEKQQNFFKRIYSHKNPSLNLEMIIDSLDEEKLNSALSLVERTITKNSKNSKV